MVEAHLPHRRISGDGPDKPDKRCSNCTTRRAECTYLKAQVRQSASVQKNTR